MQEHACNIREKVSVIFPRRISFFFLGFGFCSLIQSVSLLFQFIYLWDFYWFVLFLQKTQKTRFMTAEDEKWKIKHARERAKTHAHTLYFCRSDASIIHFVDFQLSVSLFIFPFGFSFSLSLLCSLLFWLIIWQPPSPKFISISLLNTNVRWVSRFFC